jgi:O-antigen/teichoic acid export membrane protein
MNNRYWGLLGRLLGYAGQFLVVFALPLVLSPALFAQYNLTIPFLTLLSSLGFGWLNGAAYRWAHALTQKHKILLRAAVSRFYKIALALALWSAWLLILLDRQYEALLVLIVFAISLKDYYQKVSNSNEDYRVYAWSNAWLLVGKIVFLGLIYRLQISDVPLIMGLFLFSEVLAIMPFRAYVGAGRHVPKWRRLQPAYGRLIGYGAPLVFSSLAVWATSLSDRYILARFVSEFEVANYILVYQMAANSITIPMMFFITVYYPRLIRMEREQGLQQTLHYNRSVFKKYLILAPLFGSAAILVIWLALKWIYVKYQTDLRLVMLIVIAQIICNAGHFYNKKYELNNQTRYIAVAVFCAAIVNVGGNFLAIPRLGIFGAALSSVGAYALLMLITPRIDQPWVRSWRGKT